MKKLLLILFLLIFSFGFSNLSYADLPPFLDYSTSAKRYEKVEVFPNLYAYQRGGLWGFSGGINIPPSFSEYTKMDNKYVKVCKNGYYGLIDNYQGLIVPTIYDDISKITIPTDGSVLAYAFTNEYDFFKVKQNGKTGVIAASGKVIVPMQYQDITSVASNYLIVKNNNKKGIYDVYENKELIPTICDDIKLGGIYNGLQTVEQWFYFKQNNKWGYFNQQGVMILKPEYDSAKILNKHYIAVKKFRWGVVDTNSNLLIPYKYDALELKGKYLKVKLNGKWGASDLSNNIIIPIDKGPVEINNLIKKLK